MVRAPPGVNSSHGNPCSRGFRVKIDLNELISGGVNRFWLFVNPSVCKTIADLQRVICARFGLPCSANDFEVRLQDFVIPGDEQVDILQANDLLLLRRHVPRQCSEQQPNLMGEHGATAYLPSFQACHKPGCCECDSGKKMPTSTVDRTTDDDQEQRPSTSGEISSPPKKKKKKKKSKELPDAVEVQEVARKSKKRGHQHYSESDELMTTKNSEVTMENKSRSNKSKEMHKPKEPLFEETPKKKKKKSQKSADGSTASENVFHQNGTEQTPKKTKSSKSVDVITANENIVPQNGTEQSSKMPDAQEMDGGIVFQDMPKKKRIRHRKPRSKNISDIPSDLDVSNMSENNTPRVSKPAFNFGSGTSANHFRFGNESTRERCDSSENRSEQVLLPDNSFEMESIAVTTSQKPQLVNPDAVLMKCTKTNSKTMSPNTAVVANLPNLHTNPDVAVDANEVPAIDYSQYPALIGHPRVKDVVAYKILELSEDYMPKVSDYMVGEVISSDPNTKEVTIQFLTPIKTKARRGKFELLENNIEEDEEFEPEEEIISTVTIEWHFVMDPKLLPNEKQLN